MLHGSSVNKSRTTQDAEVTGWTWNALCSPSALMSRNPCKWHSVSDSGASGFSGWTARSSRLEASDAWWLSLALATFQSAPDSFGLFDLECRGFRKECVLPFSFGLYNVNTFVKKSVAFLFIFSSIHILPPNLTSEYKTQGLVNGELQLRQMNACLWVSWFLGLG